MAASVVTPTPAVGNDVVDLSEPGVRGKAGDGRFVRRVLHPSEVVAVTEARDPDRALFTSWAAKEAAFKVVSKLRGAPPVFAHRAFVHRGETVEYEGTHYPLRIEALGTTIHVVATSGVDPAGAFAERHPLTQPGSPWNGSLDQLIGGLTPREAEPVHSLASAAVRLGARRALATLLEVEESRLQIVCAPGMTGRRPPRALLDGAPAPADVSLSHHGGQIGWAILLG